MKEKFTLKAEQLTEEAFSDLTLEQKAMIIQWLLLHDYVELSDKLRYSGTNNDKSQRVF